MISLDNIPDHFGLSFKGTTVSWSGMDTLERFERHMSEPASREKLQSLEFDKHSIVYRYNQCGFRDEEFCTYDSCIMALGGSMTEGTGVEEQNIWCSVLQNLVGTKVWNMGIGACAMDTCFRILDYYLPILNPCAVVLVEPPPARFELFAHYGSFDVYGPHLTNNRNESFIKEYLISDINAELNIRKNRLAMSKICQDRDIPIYFFMPEDAKIDGRARDLSHPGRESHKDFAVMVYETIGNLK